MEMDLLTKMLMQQPQQRPGMRLSLVDGEKRAELQLEEMTDTMKHKTLEGVFEVFGVSFSKTTPPQEPQKVEVPKPVVNVTAAQVAPDKAKQGEVTVVKPPVPTPAPATRPAPAPLNVMADPTYRLFNKSDIPAGMNSISEWLEHHHANDKKEGKYWHKTGIMYKADKPAFRCKYNCNKCNMQSLHYIWDGTKSVDCHGCQTTLQVKKAVPGVHGLAQDPQGNFFIAGNLAPLIYVHGKSRSGYVEHR